MSVNDVLELAEREANDRRATDDLEVCVADAIVVDGGEE